MRPIVDLHVSRQWWMVTEDEDGEPLPEPFEMEAVTLLWRDEEGEEWGRMYTLTSPIELEEEWKIAMFAMEEWIK